MLDLLLPYALRAWFEAPQAPSGWARASRDPELSIALRLIHDHPQHLWTVAELAARCNLSRAAFARRFTELTGQPPLTHLTWWRMTLAARLLRAGDHPLSAIAEQVGYGSEYAFSRRSGASTGWRRPATAPRQSASATGSRDGIEPGAHVRVELSRDLGPVVSGDEDLVSERARRLAPAWRSSQPECAA